MTAAALVRFPASELRLGVVTWSPLGGGMLTGKYRKGEKGRAEGLGGKVFQPENSAQRTQILDTVLAIAGELGVGADQVAIAWAGTHGAVPMNRQGASEQNNRPSAAVPAPAINCTTSSPALLLGTIGEAIGGLDGKQAHRRRPAAALVSA